MRRPPVAGRAACHPPKRLGGAGALGGAGRLGTRGRVSGALLAGRPDVKGKVVVAILSGGNVDAELFSRIIAA